MYKRSKKSPLIHRRPCRTFGRDRDEDITCFAKKSDEIFAGRRNGYLNVYSADDPTADEVVCKAHADRIKFVDFNGRIFVSTSLDETAFWRKEYEFDVPYLEPTKKIPSGNKSLRLSPKADRLATGKYSERPGNALRLIDMET